MKEKRDLYNEKKELINQTIYKGEAIPDNRYILTVTLFAENSSNKFLIQKRSEDKGGKYGFVSGHPKTGETSSQGIISEVKEEMGIDIKEHEIVLFQTEKNKNSFFDFYYMKKDIELLSLTLQKEEVESVMWVSLAEMDEFIKEGEFYSNHIEAFEILKDYIKKTK